MNPVLKLVSGDSASPAGEAAPPIAHLVRCARCGELNGRSADACWNCEADLQWRAAFPGLSAVPTPPAAVHEAWHDLGEPPTVGATAGVTGAGSSRPAGLQLDLPVLSSAVDPDDWAGARAAMPRAALPNRAPRWPALGLLAGVGALIIAGLYLAFDMSAEPPRLSGGPLAAQRERVTAPAGAPIAELAPVDAALRSAERALEAQPVPEPLVAPAGSPPVRTDDAAPPKAAAPLARARAPVRSAAATPVAPALVRPVRPAGTPAVACTPNVIALGLCTPASNTPKE